MPPEKKKILNVLLCKYLTNRICTIIVVINQVNWTNSLWRIHLKTYWSVALRYTDTTAIDYYNDVIPHKLKSVNKILPGVLFTKHFSFRFKSTATQQLIPTFIVHASPSLFPDDYIFTFNYNIMCTNELLRHLTGVWDIPFKNKCIIINSRKKGIHLSVALFIESKWIHSPSSPLTHIPSKNYCIPQI